MERNLLLYSCEKYKEIPKEEIKDIIAVDARVLFPTVLSDRFINGAFWRLVADVTGIEFLSEKDYYALSKATDLKIPYEELKDFFTQNRSEDQYNNAYVVRKILEEIDVELPLYAVSFVMCAVFLTGTFCSCNYEILYNLLKDFKGDA